MSKCEKASLEDVPAIMELIDSYAKDGLLLRREKSEIMSHIDNFLVIKSGFNVVACASLSAYSESLVEIRSLVVHPDYQGRGLGAKIVFCAERLASERKFKRVFVLTRSEEFFKKQSYVIADKKLFPDKIWKDCQICPRKNQCDEVAMQKFLS